MAGKDYTYRRRGSQNWYVRWMVPLAAREIIRRAQFTKSLGVTNDKVAVDLARQQIVAWKQQVAAALAGSTSDVGSANRYEPSLAELEDVAVTLAYETAGERAAQLIKAKANLGDAAYEALRAKFKERLGRAVREAQAGDGSFWEERARRAVQQRGWIIDEGSPKFGAFVGALITAGIDTFGAALAKMDGVEHHFTPSTTVQEVVRRRQDQAKSGESIMELFERYAAQRLAEKRKRLDTVNQDRKVVGQFAAFIGAERNVRSISRADVREWRDTVAALPPNFRKQKRYQHLTAREAASEARAAGAKGVAPNTINKYLSTISPLFDWMMSGAYVDANPCEGLFYDARKGANPRPPFSTEQLNKILNSPLFTGFLRDGKEHQEGNTHATDWRFWIPLICLFTGARIGEIAQLRAEDIKQEFGIWFIHIRDDEATGQRTKSGHSRPAPVHSTLQKLGFLCFVEQQRRRCAVDGNHQLFATLVPNARGQISGIPSRFWRNYLQAIGVKDGGDGFGAHSFRHTMADQLRSAGYLDEQIAVALGHNLKTVTSGYGRLRQGTVTMLNDMIEAVRFEGVSLDHLVVEGTA